MDTQNNQNQPPEEEKEILDVVIAKKEEDKPALKVLGDEVVKKIDAAAVAVSVLKKKWTKKKIINIKFDDKKGRELLKTGRAEMRTLRVNLTKELKSDIKPFLDAVAFYRSGYGGVIEAIEANEVAYDAKHLELQQKDKEEDEREEREAEDKLNARVDELKKYGVIMIDGYYTAGDKKYDVELVTVGIADIKVMPDMSFDMLLTKISETNALVAERKDAEEKRLEQEKIDKDAQELKDKQELQEKQDLLDKQQKEQDEEKQNLINMRLETRGEVLEAMGMVYNENKKEFRYPDSIFAVSTEFVGTADKAKWDECAAIHKTAIAVLKQDLLDKITKQKALDELRTKRGKELIELDLFYAHERKIWCYGTVSLPLISDERFDTLSDEEWNIEIIRVKEVIAEAKAKKLLYDIRLAEIIPYLPYGPTIAKEKITYYSEHEYNLMLQTKKDARLEVREAVLYDHGYVVPDGSSTFVNADAWPIEPEQIITMNDLEFDAQVKNIGIAISKKKQERETLKAQGDAAIWNDYVAKVSAIIIPVFTSEAFRDCTGYAQDMIENIQNFKK